MEPQKAELVTMAGLRASGIWKEPPGVRTLWRWVAQGKLPSYKIGRVRLFDPREIAGIIRNKYRVAAFHE
jgi:hypothetical protein